MLDIFRRLGAGLDIHDLFRPSLLPLARRRQIGEKSLCKPTWQFQHDRKYPWKLLENMAIAQAGLPCFREVWYKVRMV